MNSENREILYGKTPPQKGTPHMNQTPTHPETLSTSLTENIATLQTLLPIGESFDLIARTLTLGQTKGYLLGVNGFCKTEILQQIFSDLQNPLFTMDDSIENIALYMNSKIGFAQVALSDSWGNILQNVLSGPVALFLDGFAQAILIDARTYPTRGITEPDTERITKGARDGFVETLLFNANLIRQAYSLPAPDIFHAQGRAGESDGCFDCLFE